MILLMTGNDAQRRIRVGVLRVLHQHLPVVMYGTRQIAVGCQQAAHEEMYLRLQRFNITDGNIYINITHRQCLKHVLLPLPID